MKRQLPIVDREKRSCGTCTKCCEGWLSGYIYGEWMQPGSPCQFSQPGRGCAIYENRPQSPCQQYSCMWLRDTSVPEWLKPEFVNAIIDEEVIDGISFIRLVEAGAPMSAQVLSWVVKYAKLNNRNLYWEVNNGKNYMGSKEFVAMMTARMGPQTLGG